MFLRQPSQKPLVGSMRQREIQGDAILAKINRRGLIG
jgi:hypothetical protein